MSQQTRILVVDDDRNIVDLVRIYMQKEGFTVSMAFDGEEALRQFMANPPHLVILDVMLPGLDGYQVCREIRRVSAIPVIMLTARGESFDKVLGLELGADDYVVKPFDPKELVARVRAVLRRFAGNEPQPGRRVAFPGLQVDLDGYLLYLNGEQVEIPPKELELLYFLASHPNRAFTREQILEKVWGYEFLGDSRTVDVHIKRLRERLNKVSHPQWDLKTVWGVGYKFEVK